MMLQAAQPSAKENIWLKGETWKPETRSIEPIFTPYILHVYDSPPYMSKADTQGELGQMRSPSPLQELGDMLSMPSEGS